MAHVEKQIEVEVPVRTAYNQWTQFEEFPEFMEGIQEVRQLDETRLHWTASIAGRQKEWDARITEQVPDERVAWVSESGAQNDGIVQFRAVGPDRTLIEVTMDFEPEGLVENVGNALGMAGGRIEGDLERFKEFIETRGVESGAWRGQVRDGEANPAGSGSMPGMPETTSRGSLGDSGTSMGYGGSGAAGQGGADYGSGGTTGESMTQGGASSGYQGTGRGGESNYGSGASQVSGSPASGGYETTDTTAGRTRGTAAGGTGTGYGGESTTSGVPHGRISQERMEENQSSSPHGAVSRDRMEENENLGYGSAAGQFGASPTPGGADMGAGETGASYASERYGETGGREGFAGNEETTLADPLGEPTTLGGSDERDLPRGSSAGPGVRPSTGDRDLQEEGDSRVDERGHEQIADVLADGDTLGVSHVLEFSADLIVDSDIQDSHIALLNVILYDKQ